jgi:hypothetical protein
LHSAKAGLKRRVEEANQRRDSPEDPQQLGVEARRRGELRLELAAREELLEAQVVSGRVILRVASRHGGQLRSVQRSDGAREGVAGHDAMKRAVMTGYVLPDQSQVG